MQFHIQELFIDFQTMMKPVRFFIVTDGHTFGSSAVSILQMFGKKLSYYYYRSFPQRMLLSKVSAKYYTCIINTTIVLT